MKLSPDQLSSQRALVLASLNITADKPKEKS
jgi:hypothetical protein